MRDLRPVLLCVSFLIVACAGPPGLDGAAGDDGPAGPPGSAGDDGTDGTPGADGADGADGAEGSSCSAVRDADAGITTITCDDGTTAIVRDGAAAAVDAGPARALVRIEDEPSGAQCAWGGHAVLTGIDDDDDGVLDSDEVDATAYLCAEPPCVIRGDVRIDEPADAVAIAGCSEITGTLRVTGAGVYEIDALSSLQTIGGDLLILAAPDLESIAGLSALGVVGGRVDIDDVPALSSLHGLEALRQVEGLLGIAYAEALTTIAPLGGLQRVDGHLRLRFLTSWSGGESFPALATLGGLELYGNTVLTALPSMPSWTDAPLGIEILANGVDGNTLPALDGIYALQKSGYDINLVGRADLAGAFPALTETYGLYLYDTVGDIPADAFASLTTVTNTLEVDTTDASDIGGFAALTQVGDLRLDGAYVAVSGFGNVGEADAILIDASPAFISMTPLTELTHLRTLEILHTGLSRLQMFPALTDIDSHFVVDDNDALVIMDLDALQDVGGNATITNNAILPVCAIDDFLAGVTVVGSTTVSGNGSNDPLICL